MLIKITKLLLLITGIECFSQTIETGSFDTICEHHSYWPFRVNAETGRVISAYCANVLEPVKLFDELIRLKQEVNLSSGKVQSYRRAREIAWNWLYSRDSPLKTFIWAQYFEDVPNDPDRSNRNQLIPMELAKYLIEHPGLDPRMDMVIMFPGHLKIKQ